jgi:ribosomal protein L37AE/L43A
MLRFREGRRRNRQLHKSKQMKNSTGRSARACRFCDSKGDVKRVKKRFWVCPKCRPAVYAVINTPDVVEAAWPLVHDWAILPAVRRVKLPWRVDIPEELDATRFRAYDRNNNSWYLIVSEFEGQPVEIFMSTADENKYELQGRVANLTALTRLVSLMLRHVFLGERITLAKIQKQLQRSSRQKRDLPDLVYRVLSEKKLPGNVVEPAAD